MNLVNLKRVPDYRVKEWLEGNIKDLTPYQKERMRNDEIVRFAPFYFMEQKSKVNNVFLRLTIIFMLPVLLLLIIGLPFNFIVTGSWGYSHGKMRWYGNWVSSCGIS